MSKYMLTRVNNLLARVDCSLFGTVIEIIASHDKKGGDRVFIQAIYLSKCTKTGKIDQWKGSKHYLSEHMTDDEIIKRAYVAFEMAIKHEILEGFKVDGIILFNPHVNFEELLKISHKEITRGNLAYITCGEDYKVQEIHCTNCGDVGCYLCLDPKNGYTIKD